MGKLGEKQKKKPKIKDKKQSERFKAVAAPEVGADQPSDTFDEIMEAMARPTRVGGNIFPGFPVA